MSSSGPFHRFLNGESDRRTRNGRYPIDIPPYTNQSNGSADAAAGHGVSAAVARNGRNNTGVQTTVASSNAGNVAAASTSSNHHTTSSRNPSHSTSTNTRRRPAQQQTGGANRSASASNNGQGAESELSGNDDPSEGSAKNATRKRKRATASSNPGPRGRNTKKAKEDKTKGSQETVKVKPFATTTYLDTHRLEPLSRFPRYFRLGTEPDTSAQISMPTTVHDREAATWQGRIAPHLPPLQKYSEIQGNIKEIDDAIRKGLDRDQVDDDEEDIEVPKRGVRGRKDRLYAYNGLDETLPPLPTLPDIFADLSRKALDLGLREILEKSPSIVLKIATLCSGTEAPLLALQMIRDCRFAVLYTPDLHADRIQI